MDIDYNIVRNGLIFFILLASCLCLRAYAQAWMANRLGDPTPRLEGRLTANPLPHVDLMGTVALPLLFIYYFQPALNQHSLNLMLGWAKPVPMNPHNFANPRLGVLLTQFAGLGMSLILCTAAAILGGLFYSAADVVGICFAIIGLNSCLIVFDCLPLPPFPGGVLIRHLGFMSEETFANIARWSGLAIIIAINLKPFAVVFSVLRAIIALPFVAGMEGIAALR